MKEMKSFLKNISLETILGWIKSERNPMKREAFKILKAQKMLVSNSKMEEILRVIKDSKLDFEGFKPYSKALTSRLEIESEELTRAYAEYNSEYRQLVCNVILEAELNGNTVFGFLKRGRTYTEKSLIGSIGMVGGHVNNTDCNLFSGLVREVSEEIRNISFENLDVFPLGYIREVSDSISKQHLCVLYCIKVRQGANINFHSTESKESFIWMTSEQIKKELQKEHDSLLDSWALCAMDAYFTHMNASNKIVS